MNVKTCNKCHIEKLLTEFYKCKKFKDGLDYTCKVCSKQNSRQHYIKNKDKIDLHNKKYEGNIMKCRISTIKTGFC